MSMISFWLGVSAGAITCGVVWWFKYQEHKELVYQLRKRLFDSQYQLDKALKAASDMWPYLDGKRMPRPERRAIERLLGEARETSS